MTDESSGVSLSNVDERGWLAPQIEALEKDPEFVAEGLALQVTEQALQLMEEQGIPRARLAEMMGTSRAYVTKLFNAPPNLTLYSIARLALAIGAVPNLFLAPTPPAADPVSPSEITAGSLSEGVDGPDESRSVSRIPQAAVSPRVEAETVGHADTEHWQAKFTIESEQEEDGRWLAEVRELLGVLAHAQDRDAAVAKVQALALRVLAHRLDYGEAAPGTLNIAFDAA